MMARRNMRRLYPRIVLRTNRTGTAFLLL